MTPESLDLDPGPFLHRGSVFLYRLARARYAVLSGAGAAKEPGRWNRPGQEAIYTSIEMGVPVLERLAHTPKRLIPANLAMMKLRVQLAAIPRPFSMRGSRFILEGQEGGGVLLLLSSLKAAHEEFREPQTLIKESVPFAIALPSVIVPVWNVVLYPDAPGFWENVALESEEPFSFDPRLFPEDAPLEEP